VSVERAWVLAFCWLPLVWLAWRWKQSPRRIALTLKALALVAILLALSEPRLTVSSTRLGVSVLVDTSASVSEADLARASSLVAQIYAARGRHAVRVIPFARGTRALDRAEVEGGWKLRHSPAEQARATNLEAVISQALAEQAPGLVPRLVLISDGRQNEGSAVRAAWQARELGVPIDTIPLEGRPRPDLRLDSVSMPLQVFAGEQFPLDLALHSPRPAEAEVEILASGKTLGVQKVALEAGSNLVRVHARLATTGAVDLLGVIRAAGLGEVRFAQAVAVRRPRVLLVSQDPPGADRHLVQVLEAAQFQVERSTEPPAQKLDAYQVIVLNNVDLLNLPEARKQALADFVRGGGGLLVIGGENNIYVDRKGVEDPLERVLPARLAPPRTPEGVAVVLIMDKSSSMEGRKIELARLAAIGVIEHLRPIDFIGILIFDNSFHWIVPIRKADDRNLLKRLVSGIMADGGTQIAPALQEAYRRILPVRAVYKHLVLLTDGISEEGDSMALARDAVANRVTISTVGLGQDVNRSFLEKLALTARGKAYLMADPSGLEQILIRDVMEHTGTTAVEKQFRPLLVRRAELFENLAMESAPPLLGYVRFIARPAADLLLKADERDPLLVRWQFGLGRSAVFTSDAKSRWAVQWVGWEGFDRFWANLFRDLLPKAPEGEAVLRYERATGDLVAEYRLAPNVDTPAEPPAIFVLGDQGVRRVMRLEKLAPGVYRGRVWVGAARGMFRVRPLEESRAFPETGVYLEEPELADYGSNPELLRQLSLLTGGRFQPSPRQIFERPGRRVPITWQLWPALLTLALVLNLAELVMRKAPGVTEALLRSRRRQPETMAA